MIILRNSYLQEWNLHGTASVEAPKKLISVDSTQPFNYFELNKQTCSVPLGINLLKVFQLI